MIPEPAERVAARTFPVAELRRRLAARPEADWLRNLRGSALASVEAKGLPTRRDEAWKYTDVGALGVAAYGAAEAPVGTPPAIKSLTETLQLVLVNGFLVTPGPEVLPAGVSISRLDASISAELVQARLGGVLSPEGKPFVALNTASFAEGVVVRIAAGTDVETPIELISLGLPGGEPVAFHPRCLVVVEAGATATLIERHCGKGRYFSNGVVEVALADHATLRHYTLQDEAADAVHVGTLGIALGKESRYEGVVVHVGARLARHEVHAGIDGDRASFSLDGAYLGSAQQHIDNTTWVTHRAVGGNSRQVFKGVLDEQAKGIFQGKVLVERDAQKTDAHQLSKALLLSDRAEMDGKPELEIYADDVKCGHGCTVGDIDEKALFYLRARGIDEETARALLIEAFLAEVMEQIAVGPVREAFAAVVGQRLGGAHLIRRTDDHW